MSVYCYAKVKQLFTKYIYLKVLGRNHILIRIFVCLFPLIIEVGLILIGLSLADSWMLQGVE